MKSPRRGTRISCKIPITLKSLDADHHFSESGTVILINPQGCGVRLGRPVEVGTTVRLEGLPNGNITAQVVNCISLGEHEKFWLLGMALDQPGNVWGVQKPPKDWF
jgi:hypothetical protein